MLLCKDMLTTKRELHHIKQSDKLRHSPDQVHTRRLAETAALRAEEVVPDGSLRRWVISFPFPFRYLFAAPT